MTALTDDVTTEPPPAPASDGPARPAGFLRRYRVWIGVVLAVVLGLAITVWSTGNDTRYPDPLDPQNPGPDGAQAVAQVLGDEGVDVTIVRSADALRDLKIGPSTTVLVTGTEELAPSTVRRLLHDARGQRIVLVEPPSYVLDAMDRGVEVDYAEDETDGDCGDARFDGLTVEVDSAVAYDTPSGCFPSGGGFVLADGVRRTSYLGAGQLLTNDQVLRGDNAAVALRLLGQHERLVWYVPTYDDADDDEAVSIWSFTPAWLVPAIWIVIVSALVLVLWRGRRMGRLAVEPLPVVVRAVETTRSRGRMYRRADDRGYATHALRAASQRRLADHLRLGRGATEVEVIGAVAHHLGRREAEVGALLAQTAPVPATDQDLVRLAQALTQLDREVRSG